MKYAILLLAICFTSSLLASDQNRFYMNVIKYTEDSDDFDIQAVYHIGDVLCAGKIISVVAVRRVIKGMKAPRGAHCIYLFEGDDFVGSHEEAAFPLRCEGSTVIFHGDITYNGDKGIALDFTDGFSKRKVIVKN